MTARLAPLFEACGADLAAFIPRRKKVDAEVVAHCEQIWQAHPLWSCAQVLAEFRRRWPEPGAHNHPRRQPSPVRLKDK